MLLLLSVLTLVHSKYACRQFDLQPSLSSGFLFVDLLGVQRLLAVQRLQIHDKQLQNYVCLPCSSQDS